MHLVDLSCDGRTHCLLADGQTWIELKDDPAGTAVEERVADVPVGRRRRAEDSARGNSPRERESMTLADGPTDALELLIVVSLAVFGRLERLPGETCDDPGARERRGGARGRGGRVGQGGSTWGAL